MARVRVRGGGGGTASDCWGSRLAADRPIRRRFEFCILPRWVPAFLALARKVALLLALVLQLQLQLQLQLELQPAIAIPETVAVAAFSASGGRRRRMLHARSPLSRKDRFGVVRRPSTSPIPRLLHEQEHEHEQKQKHETPDTIRNPQPQPNEIQKGERERKCERETTPSPPSIEWIPTRIEFEGVYRSYGAPSLWRKLTSSVPRRQWALENLTLVLGNRRERDNGNVNNNDNGNQNSNNDDSGTIFLLLGASSSGKSTVLKSILGAGGRSGNGEYNKDNNDDDGFFASDQNRGSVRIVSNGCGKQHPGKDQSAAAQIQIQIPKPKPVLLDDRGELREGNTVVREGWDRVLCRPNSRGGGGGGRSAGNGDRNGNGNGNRNESGEFADAFRRLLLEDTAALLDLDLDARVSDLTPSQRYKFVLGKACLESSTGGGTNGRENNSNNDNNKDDSWCVRSPRPQGPPQLRLPGPVLLLDEWMDVESSVVVRAVQESLHRIASQRGGVVVSVTHKPGLYDGNASGNASGNAGGSGRRLRTIKLSAGKLLRG